VDRRRKRRKVASYPTFSELSYHSLEDLEIIYKREKISLIGSSGVKEIY